jgi:hypothetical protein
MIVPTRAWRKPVADKQPIEDAAPAAELPAKPKRRQRTQAA